MKNILTRFAIRSLIAAIAIWFIETAANVMEKFIVPLGNEMAMQQMEISNEGYFMLSAFSQARQYLPLIYLAINICLFIKPTVELIKILEGKQYGENE